MIQVGSTLFLPTPDIDIPHLWVVLTTPSGHEKEVVIVNITTKRGDSDLTLVLNVGDHPFIKHPSCVRYSDATITRISSLENAINSGYFNAHRDCTDELLLSIQEGIFASEFTPRKVKEFCKPII